MKYKITPFLKQQAGRRSREGAWIEIFPLLLDYMERVGRSREGAWIEIVSGSAVNLGFFRRSREGAWIEIDSKMVRACRSWSLPRGSVD